MPRAVGSTPRYTRPTLPSESLTPITNPGPPANPGRTARIVAVFLAFFVAWMGALGYLRWHDPRLDHGDPTTDANILNAGENFDREGMLKSYGIPAIDTCRAADKRPDYYITYPPGAYWFHEALKGVGVDTPGGFRVASLAVCSLAVLLLWALLRRLCGDPLPAALGCVLYITAKPFVEYADNLHYIALAQATLFGTLYAWTRFEDEQGSRASLAWLIGAGVLFFIDSWLTFEHALFILAFALVRVLWLRRPGRLVAVLLLGVVPALVLGVRILLDRAVLGSFESVWEVLRAKAEQRVGSAAAGTGFRELLDAWLPRLSWPGASIPPDSPDAEFAVPFLSWWFIAPAGALLMLAVGAWHLPAFRPFRRAIGVGGLLLVCGLTWFAAMTEHAIVHRFTALLILPGLAALGGALIAGGLAQRQLHPRGAPARWVGRLLAVVALGAWVSALGSSFALNRAVVAFTGLHPPSPTVAAANARRDGALASFAAAGATLKHIDRLRMFDVDAPAARALGRPFDNTPGVIPASLGPREALLIPLWSASARRAAVAAASKLGLPDQVGPAIDPYLVFRPSGAEPGAPGVTTNSGLVITRAALRATLDNSGWLFCAIATGPLEQLRQEGFRLELRAESDNSDPNGRKPGPVLATITIPDALGLRDGDTALLRAAIPNGALAGARGVDIRAVVPGHARQAGFDVGKSAADKPTPWSLTDRVWTWPLPAGPGPRSTSPERPDPAR